VTIFFLVCISFYKYTIDLLNDSTDGTARGADDLLPIIILVIIRAQPQTWWSDIRFIQRFRNPKKLSAEAGYYLTQMVEVVVHICFTDMLCVL
jgi:hypothetical protein